MALNPGIRGQTGCVRPLKCKSRPQLLNILIGFLSPHTSLLTDSASEECELRAEKWGGMWNKGLDLGWRHETSRASSLSIEQQALCLRH